MDDQTQCPQCDSPYGYADGASWMCPECGHEWRQQEAADASGASTIRDANGTVLNDGDTVTVIKDLKYRGGVIKVGTKAKSIRLIPDPADGHDVECKLPGVGQMALKAIFLKKVSE